MRRPALSLVFILFLAPALSAQASAGDSVYRSAAGSNSRTFAPTNKGFTGLGWGAPLTTGPDGTVKWASYPVVRNVVADSPAAQAGLAVGDSIITVNGADARAGRIFDAKEGGEKYTIRVRRGMEYMDFAFIASRRVTPPVP